MRVANILNKIATTFIGLTLAGSAYAQDSLERVGIPVDKGLNFQPAATELARDQQWVDNFLLYIITAICIFVTALLLVCLVRFNKRANPKPAAFTHPNLAT